jgi:hypothetical protein
MVRTGIVKSPLGHALLALSDPHPVGSDENPLVKGDCIPNAGIVLTVGRESLATGTTRIGAGDCLASCSGVVWVDLR